MISIDDFVLVHPTGEIQRAAIDYAGRSLHYTYDRMGYGPEARDRLIRIAVGIVIEQAFEAYLRQQGIVFDTIGRTHWRSTDKAEFVINDQRIDIKGYHVYPRPGRIFPHWFLDAEGLVPYGQLKGTNAPDIYLQAFLVAPQLNSSDQHLFVGVFPKGWCERWREARPVVVRSTAGIQGPVEFVVAGEGPEGVGHPCNFRADTQETFVLSGGSAESQARFSSLQYVAAKRRPQGEVLVSVDRGNTTQIREWHDVWFQEPQVYFTGWAAKRDYERSGVYLPKGANTKVYDRTRTGNVLIPIRDLRSLFDLL